jgi:flavin-dependent dehydrogenase
MTVGARTGVCIVGGGPAGAALAIRLAQLGHSVVLAERRRLPRHRLGELLSPGVWAQLDLLGAHEAIVRAGFRPCRRALVRWESGVAEAHDFTGSPGLLVDRERFDALLRDSARAHGVPVLQPAAIHRCRRNADGWSLDIETGEGALRLEADFLATATGRSAAPRGGRRVIGCYTIALYADWQGTGLPAEPRIEAGDEAWYWGMPLPDGHYSTMAFVDFAWLRRQRAASLGPVFDRLMAHSRLFASCRAAERASPVRAADATTYLDETPIMARTIKVGEAALALDPLSASGVQRAIQSALAGAVVVNTVLRRPDCGAAAARFYRNSLTAAAARHERWAAAFYRRAATGRGSRFWHDRAAGAAPASEPPAAADPMPGPDMPVTLAAAAELVATPCIIGDFVVMRSALCHPRLDEPVAFIGGCELAPLLRQLRAGMTIRDVAQCWSRQIAPRSALAIIGWLLETGVLMPARHGSDATANIDRRPG